MPWTKERLSEMAAVDALLLGLREINAGSRAIEKTEECICLADGLVSAAGGNSVSFSAYLAQLSVQWPDDRRDEVRRLRALLASVANLQKTAQAFTTLRSCIETAERLSRIDLGRGRVSLRNFLIEQAHG